MRLPPPLRAVARLLPRAAVFTDFDGTLSPIVDDPAAAKPAPGAADALRALSARAAKVWVVTGRPAAFVAPLGVPAVGQHGHEQGPPLASILEATRLLEPLGLPVEPKSHMLTVHYRSDPSRRGEVEREAAAVAASLGLVTAPAKMGVELRPSRAGKGEVVTRLARGARAALYAGDDHGDIPAFDALRRLGVPVASVAVLGKETPPELVQAADVVCESPYAWVAWLRQLATEGR